VGLALVKRIIEVHGGEVWIESEGAVCGCAVMFTLPKPLTLTQYNEDTADRLKSIA